MDAGLKVTVRHREESGIDPFLQTQIAGYTYSGFEIAGAFFRREVRLPLVEISAPGLQLIERQGEANGLGSGRRAVKICAKVESEVLLHRWEQSSAAAAWFASRRGLPPFGISCCRT